MRVIWAALSVVCVVGCAAPQLRDVDEAQGTCVLQDGRSGPYVAPAVSEPGAHPRLPHPPAEGAPVLTGAYDCLVTTSGALGECRVIRSVPGADELAPQALATWRFKPATCAGEAVPSRITVRLTPRYIPRCDWDDTMFRAQNKAATVDEAVERAKRLEEQFGQGQYPFAVELPDGRCATSDGREGELAKLEYLTSSPLRASRVAIERKEQGAVAVRCVLRASGRLEGCTLACSDTPANEEIVLRELATWQVSPPRCGNEPVELIHVGGFAFTVRPSF